MSVKTVGNRADELSKVQVREANLGHGKAAQRCAGPKCSFFPLDLLLSGYHYEGSLRFDVGPVTPQLCPMAYHSVASKPSRVETQD